MRTSQRESDHKKIKNQPDGKSIKGKGWSFIENDPSNKKNRVLKKDRQQTSLLPLHSRNPTLQKDIEIGCWK
ncbi:hypothetical protein [Oenococcus oeni]|uniref:hypothetical protein n=1 Tax=Oenococcus oeni TaxID=1247 RepID=UPI00214CDD73|nr:hypothetical protein [Oenococcus oeni]